MNVMESVTLTGITLPNKEILKLLLKARTKIDSINIDEYERPKKNESKWKEIIICNLTFRAYTDVRQNGYQVLIDRQLLNKIDAYIEGSDRHATFLFNIKLLSNDFKIKTHRMQLDYDECGIGTISIVKSKT